MNLTVNQLPSITWNKLHMNEANLSLEGDLSQFVPGADYDPADISWTGRTQNTPLLRGDYTALTEKAPMGFGETEENQKMERPLVLSYAYGKEAKAMSRLSLHAKSGSHLKALLVLSGEPSVSVLQAEVVADQDSKVDLYLADLLGEKSLCLNHIAGRLAENAEVNLIRLDLGGEKIYSGVNMELLGTGASYHSETGCHVKRDQVLDMNYVAVHRGKHTNCEMQVNGTLEEGAKKVFRGTIDFRQGCAGAKAAENENVLLMGEELQNQTLPVILCREEDVEGSHGASIGQLDEKVLFYLETRGISREAAQAMIAQARIDAICEKLPSEAVRNQVREFEKVRGISHGEEL